MESLQESLSALAEVFNTTMESFQRDLKRASPTSNSTSSLTADFNAFRSFILSALNTLQQQVLFLGQAVDRQEMQKRRKMLLFHGITEDRTQVDANKITTLVTEQLKLSDFHNTSITKCYRLGKPSDKKPRPIVVKFQDTELRDRVWYSKTKLKGTGVTQSEFLTKVRQSVFLLARQRFGVSKCWTRYGNIYILMPDGSRHQIESSLDIDKLYQESSAMTSVSLQPKISNPKATTTSKTDFHRSKRIIKK